jgi:hypothetical protein
MVLGKEPNVVDCTVECAKEDARFWFVLKRPHPVGKDIVTDCMKVALVHKLVEPNEVFGNFNI